MDVDIRKNVEIRTLDVDWLWPMSLEN